MRIVLDFRPALRHSTGVGTYVRNLAWALADNFPEDSLAVFSASWKHRLNGSTTPATAEVHDWRIPVRALDWAWHRWRWPAVERFVGPIDVAHSPSPLLLPARRARTVITVHDCYFLRHPEHVFGTVQRDYVPLARSAAQRADAIIAMSDTGAAEAVDVLGVSRDKICVTPLGVSRAFFQATPQPAAEVLQRAGVDRPFLLFVGRREMRKDLDTLLAAFAELVADSDDLQLVLVGQDAPGWRETWESAPAAARRLTRMLPHQSDNLLPALYAAAAVVVAPSRWEGFGLTGLEAMAAGTPVVAASAGALPETFADAALFAPPGDAAAWSQQCGRLLQDKALAATMGLRGQQRAAAFRWSTTARLTHELYERLPA